jgi:hypothetical protein
LPHICRTDPIALPGLSEVVSAWHSLPASVRDDIGAMVRACLPEGPESPPPDPGPWLSLPLETPGYCINRPESPPPDADAKRAIARRHRDRRSYRHRVIAEIASIPGAEPGRSPSAPLGGPIR